MNELCDLDLDTIAGGKMKRSMMPSIKIPDTLKLELPGGLGGLTSPGGAAAGGGCPSGNCPRK